MTKKDEKNLAKAISILNDLLDSGKTKAGMFNGEEIDFFSYEFDEDRKQFVVVAH